MLFRKALFIVCAGLLTCFSLQAQTFETRSTRYSGDVVLRQMDTLATIRQKAIRDSVTAIWTDYLAPSDTIETFFNDYHLGLVIYRAAKPYQLLGFWDRDGKPVDGGSLTNGTGTVKTPFNPEMIQSFKTESVKYRKGVKNGSCFYYCDCASVLRKGTFVSNQKSGLWKEFAANGEFIHQKRLKLPPPPKEIKINDNDLRAPAHCMMQPDKICPNPGGTSK